jgi:3-oxoacyl-[acyl-carrier-protein] synthase-3
MKPVKSKLLATGCYLPAKLVRNEDLTQFSPAVISLIAEKTGVRERRHASEGENTSDLATHAARAALAKAQFDPAKLQCIILATSSPDRIHPATATRLQHAIGASNAFAFDVNSVCSGGLYAVAVGDAFIRSGFCENTLVVASEIYSRFLNPEDVSTYPYFGDGAGAVLLSGSEDGGGIEKILLRSDGAGANMIQVPGGGTMKPLSACTAQDMFFRMRGREVFHFAVTKGAEVIQELLASSRLEKESVACFITHQANINIVRELSQRLKIPIGKFYVNLDRYGNTAAASTFIALDEALATGAARPGDYVVLAVFGGGLSWGAGLFRL